MIRRIRARVQQILLSLFFAFDVLLFYPLLCFLPYGWAFPVTRWRGNLHYKLMKEFRARVLRDLAQCFPDRSEREREEIAKGVFQIQATFFYDTYLWTRYREKAWTKRFVTFEGLEHLDASLNEGRGVILCTMHFNSYFYPGGFFYSRGYEVAPYAVNPWDMKKVNFFVKLHHAYLMWMSGLKTYARYIFAGRQPKGEIERRLACNEIFYLLLDIPLPEKQDLREVTFFGQRGLFPSSVIFLQYKTKVPFHVMYAVRDRRDWRRQTVFITEALRFTGDVDKDLQLVVNELEKGIRKYPMFWWGWGMLHRMRPEHIQAAREKKDFATRVRRRRA